MKKTISLAIKSVKENSHAEEEESVDVDNVPPQRHFGCVRKLPLQLGLFLFTQLWSFFMLQATETRLHLLAEARFFLRF